MCIRCDERKQPSEVSMPSAQTFSMETWQYSKFSDYPVYSVNHSHHSCCSLLKWLSTCTWIHASPAAATCKLSSLQTSLIAGGGLPLLCCHTSPVEIKSCSTGPVNLLVIYFLGYVGLEDTVILSSVNRAVDFKESAIGTRGFPSW